MTTLDLNPTPRDLAVQLQQFRAERANLRVELDAHAGNGWQVDVDRVSRPPRIGVTAADMDAVLAGRALPAVDAAAVDKHRRYLTLDAIIRTHATRLAAIQIAEIQRRADACTATLRDLVTAGLKAAGRERLSTIADKTRDVLEDLRLIRVEREALRSEDVTTLPPLTGLSPSLEDAGAQIVLAAERMAEAAKGLDADGSK